MLMFARPHVSQRCCNRVTSEHKNSVPICPGEKISAALQNSHSYDGSGLTCARRLDELKTDGSDPSNAERRAARPAYQRALKGHG